MKPKSPDLSVVTVCRNNADTISLTLESVEAQAASFSGRLQHIIIDGASTDGTWEMTTYYQDQVEGKLEVTVHREDQPKGIYPAMNYGLSLARGAATNFLNGDDFFPDEPVLDEIHGHFASGEADAVFGKIDHTERGTKNVVKSGKMHEPFVGFRQFFNGWYMPHQAMWANTEMLQELGFDEQYRIAADTDQCIRFVMGTEPERLVRLEKTLAYMGEGGVASRTFIKGLRERIHIFKANFPEEFSTFWYLLKRAGRFKRIAEVLGMNLKHGDRAQKES